LYANWYCFFGQGIHFWHQVDVLNYCKCIKINNKRKCLNVQIFVVNRIIAYLYNICMQIDIVFLVKEFISDMMWHQVDVLNYCTCIKINNKWKHKAIKSFYCSLRRWTSNCPHLIATMIFKYIVDSLWVWCV